MCRSANLRCCAQVRFGNCEEDDDDLIPIIVEENDCICAHRMGSTCTFYRDKSLPVVVNTLWNSAETSDPQDMSKSEATSASGS